MRKTVILAIWYHVPKKRAWNELRSYRGQVNYYTGNFSATRLPLELQRVISELRAYANANGGKLPSGRHQ
jgi:hypothetical protein